MIDDSLILECKKIGLSEYEAKVYLILIGLRVASAREIHEQTMIPRGRIYETLTLLAQKGFIVPFGSSPVRYSPVDPLQTCERLKRESIHALEQLCGRLQSLKADTPEMRMQGYELRTEWTRDNQIRMMLRRAKTEIILLCNDEIILTTYRHDIIHAAKHLDLYLVVGREELAELIPIPCYAGGVDIESSLFQSENSQDNSLVMKMFIIADRRESLSVMEEKNQQTGILISPDIYAEYLSKKIIHEIKPRGKPRKRG